MVLLTVTTVIKTTAAQVRDLFAPYNLILKFIAIYLVTATLTRIVLIGLNWSELGNSVYWTPVSLAVGAVFDLLVALCATFALTALLLVLPARWKPFFFFRWLVLLGGFLYFFGCLYLAVAELVFFDEFSSRFNYVAVDYLIYPHEVFVNIWDTYPVLTILLATFGCSLILNWLTRKSLRAGFMAYPARFRRRLTALLIHGSLATVLLLGLNTGLARISNNRIMNEITLDGVYSFVYAGFTNELDYDLYYKTCDERLAITRLKQLIADNHSLYLEGDSSLSIVRRETSDWELHRFNIVLVLEESLGSKFIGSLTPDGPCLTPRFDSLAEQGMLFSNVYATGNRTVRGLEASLLSFPPIPGRSVIKRPGNENLFSLPAVLKELDYNTVFLYGGLSYFDNFKHFAATNNFDRIIDELDFDDPTFSTIWGVCDEDLFGKSLEVFDSLSRDGKPFFATLITVSNHTPYTYPEGRIPFDPAEKKRANAVRYADYAIGKFINDAKSHSYFDSTLFVFLADHGARVYGSEQIPLRSYRIPVLFYNPRLIPKCTRIDILGSQLDLAPTILDFLGFDYNSEFFGRSMLATDKRNARVLMSHNRDVSLLRNDTLVVLGIRGNEEMWHFDTSGGLEPVPNGVPSQLPIDAISYYMTAYDMFKQHRLHPVSQKSLKPH